MSEEREPLFVRAVIVGAGLIGGSLAIAGKRAGLFGVVAGVGRNEKTLEKARHLGIIDEAHTDIEEAVKGADLLFVSTPVESIVDIIMKAAPYLDSTCIITDGGSVKGPIVTGVEEKYGQASFFIGGHPIAGGEKSGPEAADADLFENHYTILTPTKKTDAQVVEKVESMWRGVGARIIYMSPEDHDETLAMISHLPHIAAYSLVDALSEADTKGDMKKLIAGGFRDTTRIASSHPSMWRDIFSMNRQKVIESMTLYEKRLAEYRRLIEEGDFDSLEERLTKVRDARNQMGGSQ